MKILLEHFCFFGSEENRNSWRETGWTRLWRNRVLLENVEWGCSSRTSRNFPCILFYDAAYHRRVNFHWRKLRSKKTSLWSLKHSGMLSLGQNLCCEILLLLDFSKPWLCHPNPAFPQVQGIGIHNADYLKTKWPLRGAVIPIFHAPSKAAGKIIYRG